MPDVVYEADAVAPAARFGVAEVRSTPALAKTSTIRALFCTTFCGACSDGNAALYATVPVPDGKVTAPVAGL